MADDTIEIEYQLTVDDYAKFSASRSTSYLGFKSLKWLFWPMLLSVFISNLVITILLYCSGNYDFYEALNFFFSSVFSLFIWSGLIIATAIYILFKRYVNYPVQRLACLQAATRGKNIYLLSPKVMHLDQNGFSEKSHYATLKYKWSGVESIAIVKKDLIFNTSVVSAHYIPSRFFKSEEEKQRIYEQCVAWHKAAQGTDEDSKEVTA